MRFLFVPQAGALGIGGITRCLAVAESAVMRGHQIGFACRPDIRKYLNRLPVEIFDLPIPQKPIATNLPVRTLAENISLRNLDQPAYLMDTIRVEMEIFRIFQPDVVFTEFQFSLAISCELFNVPLVSTASWYIHPLFDSTNKNETATENYNFVRKKFGLSSISHIGGMLLNASAYNIAPTIPELEPGLGYTNKLVYTGPLLHSSIELNNLDYLHTVAGQRKWLYVYMSISHISEEELVKLLLNEFSDSEYFVIVSLRSQTFENRPLPLHLNNLYIGYHLPGLAIASESEVVITRGGQNTLMACMLAGVPVIGIPGNTAEPFYNVDSLCKLGAALHFVYSDEKVPNLSQYVQKITENPQYKFAAQDIGNKLRAYDGAHGVVKIMESTKR